jgi:ABC-type oligopeptide transport system substrate-binding subunit
MRDAPGVIFMRETPRKAGWFGPARAGAVLLTACLGSACSAPSAESEFFGRVDPPEGQVLRFISGSEPESLDPQVATGQPESRIMTALFEGLTEYHPKTTEPIPGIAERWDVNEDSSEFVFHLRPTARWSNGEPITAHDFVYTFRRGLDPAFAARNAYMAYYILYAQAYNEGGVFVRDPATGAFVLERDVSGDSDQRLVLPGAADARRQRIEEDRALAAAVAGKELVPIRAEDVGVDAVDDRTLRVTLTRPAPFFVGMMAHQFFRPVPRRVVEQHGDAWIRPEHIVVSGPFVLREWRPYDRIVAVRNPMYWDAAAVRLDEIRFYPVIETTTMMNLYKAGEVDATYNHTVPPSWLPIITKMKDYMDAPEIAIEYYAMNVTRPPMDDLRVRKAFNIAIDKEALARFRVVVKPLTAFTPEGIFPGYPQPRGDEFDAMRARELLAEAGYRDSAGNYDPAQFPVGDVEIVYNTLETNRQVAEFVQQQWKQHLGVTVPLRNMEFRTFLSERSQLRFKGFARAGWIGDYMDPYTFLELFAVPSPGTNNDTGWYDPAYVRMLEEANRTLDHQKRYELLAKAEAYMLEAQPIIPLMTRSTDWMKKPYVKGMYPNPGTQHAWKYVYIEHDPAKWDYDMPDLTD